MKNKRERQSINDFSQLGSLLEKDKERTVELEKFVIDSAIQLNNLLSDSYSNIKKVFMENPFPFSDGERPLIRGDIYYMNKKGEMVTGDQLIIDNGK